MPVMPSPTGPGIPETMSKAEIARLFHEVAGPDGEIDWQELKRLMDQIMKEGKQLFPSPQMNERMFALNQNPNRT